MSRCDSAAIVPNTSELLPEPDTPVNTVSRRFGIATLTSLRLFTRAPCTRMRSWRSAAFVVFDAADAGVRVDLLIVGSVRGPGGSGFRRVGRSGTTAHVRARRATASPTGRDSGVGWDAARDNARTHEARHRESHRVRRSAAARLPRTVRWDSRPHVVAPVCVRAPLRPTLHLAYSSPHPRAGEAPRLRADDGE